MARLYSTTCWQCDNKCTKGSGRPQKNKQRPKGRGVGMKKLYKSAFSKQSQNDDNDDDAKKTDGGMEWRFVLYCALFAAGEKERGTTVPIVVNRLGKECPSKGSGQRKKKGAKKIKHRRSQTRHYLHANRQKFGERMGQWGGGVGMGL